MNKGRVILYRVIGILLSVFVLCSSQISYALPADQKKIYNERIGHFDVHYDTSSCGGSTTLSGDNNAAKVFNYLTGKGLTPAQAAGVVGNMIAESGLNPQRLQHTGINENTTPAQALAAEATNPKVGWGIVQWTPPSKMINPTTTDRKDPTDLVVQLDFLWNQLNTNEKPALTALQATSTPESAAQAFEEKYERPSAAELSRSLPARQTNAVAIFANSTGTPLPPSVANNIYSGAASTTASTTPASTPATTPAAQATGSSCGGTNTGSLTGYQNPFRDLKNSHVMRLDGGMDYGGAGTGSGPVYAVGNATVTYIKVAGSGWPGLGTSRSGAYISYKLTDGSAQGKSIYIAEDCTPRVGINDTVTPNTVVCDYKDQGTHLEIGWGSGTGSYVSWSDYPGAENSFASNSGQDISKFLSKLGVAPGIVQGRLSTVPPPADWPKW